MSDEPEYKFDWKKLPSGMNMGILTYKGLPLTFDAPVRVTNDWLPSEEGDAPKKACPHCKGSGVVAAEAPLVLKCAHCGAKIKDGRCTVCWKQV